jgi:ankyrin repeat protein
MKDKLKELHESAKVGDLSKIQDIYASGFDITAKDLNGWDILIIASYNGMFVIVKWILESGLLNVNTRNFKGTTAAMYAMTFAAKTKDKSILKYLIFMGADLKAVDQNNFDIFHYAQEYDIELYMELLNYVR